MEVKEAVVIGTGAMGPGIAACLALAGARTTVVSRSANGAMRGVFTTQALIEQKLQAFRREPLSFWWFRTLEAGGDGLTLDEDVWAARQVDVGPNGKEELVAEVCAVAKGMNRTAQFSKKAVAQFLKSVGVDVNAKDSRGVRVWRIPALAEARVAFERHVGGALDWDGV